MADAALLREVINRDTISSLALRIENAWKDFNRELFIEKAVSHLSDLALMERLDQVTETLAEFLPETFERSADILIKSLPPEIGDERRDLDGLDLSSENGFIIIALTNYIARFGSDCFDISMNAFLEMTKRFSSEGSIRHFLISHEEAVLNYYRKWIYDKNVHVRRLVSESLRPRLPWAVRLKQYVIDPTPILEFLEILKDDPELYVRRSVANNLNDISKDNPAVVTDTLKRWSRDDEGRDDEGRDDEGRDDEGRDEGVNSDEMKWLIKHALRTLIKKGDPKALAILGFRADADISLSDIQLESDSIELGDSLNFTVTVVNTGKRVENLVIDYVLHFMKANGKPAPKVFKLKTGTVKSGESIVLRKKHPLKKINTRTYYPGTQALSMKVNGREFDKVFFDLKIT